MDFENVRPHALHIYDSCVTNPLSLAQSSVHWLFSNLECIMVGIAITGYSFVDNLYFSKLWNWGRRIVIVKTMMFKLIFPSAPIELIFGQIGYWDVTRQYIFYFFHFRIISVITILHKKPKILKILPFSKSFSTGKMILNPSKKARYSMLVGKFLVIPEYNHVICSRICLPLCSKVRKSTWTRQSKQAENCHFDMQNGNTILAILGSIGITVIVVEGWMRFH